MERNLDFIFIALKVVPLDRDLQFAVCTRIFGGHQGWADVKGLQLLSAGRKLPTQRRKSLEDGERVPAARLA